ncbi:anhydro-N-acetylmuramic acid kinase [Arhodomonas sp. AD133]|uniref:anhydro-N-acetylmuramic acid kinase n=1 Tax=Arhodomonas sp. AD133 TaxID=3415009 RepID=UPI003EBCAE69
MARYFVGLMAGTSLDAVDAALVALADDGTVAVAHICSRPIPQALRSELADIGPRTHLETVVEADERVADLFATTVDDLLARADMTADCITAIGSHGQTVWHRPGAPAAATVQIGNPNRIAEITGIRVIADFRRRDIAAGGEGAPLAPAFHLALLRQHGQTGAALNLGGIANLTIATGASPLGFDCGPANTLLDGWAARHLGVAYDDRGQWAATGHADDALLTELLADEFFGAPPPKSTGPEHFNLAWLEARLARHRTLSPEDVQATLTELTARSVADALKRTSPAPSRLLVCGGGVHNDYLMARLATVLPDWRVETTAALGVDPDYVEAAAFGWLAARTLDGLAGNVPSVTGAAQPVVLGGVYAGSL